MVNRLHRWARHAAAGPWSLRRVFPPSVREAIAAAVKESEQTHGGEIRFAVEAALAGPSILRGLTPRERAAEVFSNLRVWNTRDNNGVLIYLLLADRDVEIVADRGLDAKVSTQEWESVCRAMEEHFRAGRFEEGALAGVRGVSALLARQFPPCTGDANELPDSPALL